MSEGYVVEINNEIVGIVVRQDGERSFRFHASARDLNALDGSIFCSPAAAQKAAHQFLNKRVPARKPAATGADSLERPSADGALAHYRVRQEKAARVKDLLVDDASDTPGPVHGEAGFRRWRRIA